MTPHGKRAEFVRRIWDYVLPTEVDSYQVTLWVPDRFCDTFGRRVSRKDLGKIDLGSTEICTLCFAKVHRSLNRLWPRLSPEFAVLVERSLNELNLWEGFDPNKIRVSGDQRDAVKARFDIADIAFAAGKEVVDRELEALSVDLQIMRIYNAKENEPKVIEVVQRRAAARAHIDLAVLTIQKIPRGRNVLGLIAARLEAERYRYRDFLRHLLINSAVWSNPNGAAFLGRDEIPPIYLNEVYNIVDRRLVNFNSFLDKLGASLDREVPPQKIISELSEMMREYIMPEQNVTTNIHVTNSQIGVLNTGSIRDVQSIDASITTLKSQGDIDVGDAFKKITEGIMSDEVLSPPERTELLSNVKFLSEMAAKKQDDRSPSVIKSVLRSVSDGITAAGPAVKALLPFIPVIAKFFGFSI